ncbi:zinc finger protein 235 [Myxocyprinus asiaticus]|uniref:zinc finger protein 235 n=1 Tax=Myxocyprinus asiaticus TaxID=70543 RepID=UPI0022226DB9|nr:zinc finger protein 235 [Myxocyprinus asiaticus]
MSKSFQLQLSSIMEIMTKTAMEEICKLVDGDFAFLRQELSRVMSENTVLKDKMLCLESEVESTRITKEETRAGTKIYRSICVQTEYGVQPSIKGIFGKEWCSSLWDHQMIEPREDTLAIDDDLYPVSPYKHKDQDCSNQLFIKEENLEVDTYTNYIGKIPQASRGQLHSSAFEPFAVNRPEVAESNKFNKRFVLDGFPEISEIQTTSSDSSDKHSIEITVIDETGEQLMAPIDDSIESDGYYILDEFSDPGPSEAQNDGRSQEIYGYDATPAESCVKRFKVQKLPGRPKLSYCDSGKVFLHQNSTKNRIRKYKCRPSVKFPKVKPNEKFRCEVCGKCFHSNTNLTVHYVVHTGERPHKCSYCGKGFSQKGNLHTHERIHRGEKPFTCQTCGKGFTQKVCLRNHERIHSGERPYTCVTCGRGFKQKITLDQHMLVHQRRAKIKAKRTLSDFISSFI